MKEFLKQKFNIIIICVTVFAILLAGFSFAYASNENTIYTRDELSERISDTGWIDLTPYLTIGATCYDCNIRKIGSVVYVKGRIDGLAFEYGNETIIFNNIPEMFRPVSSHSFPTSLGNSSIQCVLRVVLNTSGKISSNANSCSTNILSSTQVHLNFSYLL